eukprot:661373-Pelagomonas_calceolata.AAC.4
MAQEEQPGHVPSLGAVPERPASSAKSLHPQQRSQSATGARGMTPVEATEGPSALETTCQLLLRADLFRTQASMPTSLLSRISKTSSQNFSLYVTGALANWWAYEVPKISFFAAFCASAPPVLFFNICKDTHTHAHIHAHTHTHMHKRTAAANVCARMHGHQFAQEAMPFQYVAHELLNAQWALNPLVFIHLLR